MRKIFFWLVIMLFLSPAASSFGFSSKEDCSKCHTLKKEEAQELLKGMGQNVKVMDIQTSPLKALWEVDVEADGKKALVYVDFTKKYLVSGSIIEIKAKRNITKERLSELTKVDVSRIPLGDALIMGSKDAKKRVIVFSDPDCPYCSKLHQEIKKVTMERKDIAFYIKMNPLPMHKEAYDKAKAIVCEKSLALLDDAFEKKPIPKPKSSCKSTAVDDSIKLAKKLGITGAPTMVMPDGRIVPGFKEANALTDLIDKK